MFHAVDNEVSSRNGIADAYLLGSKIPFFLKTSQTMGTVELTGLEMTRTNALGQFLTMPSDKSRIMPALI